jgi:hypothetical protein
LKEDSDGWIIRISAYEKIYIVLPELAGGIGVIQSPKVVNCFMEIVT